MGGTAGAFGANLAGNLGLTEAPTVVTHTAQGQPLAVMRVSTDGRKISESRPFAPEDAFHIVLQLGDLPPHELKIAGRFRHTDPYPKHSVSILDLKTEPQTRIVSAHEALVFYIPTDALNEVASEYGTPAVEGFQLDPGVPRLDPVMARLGHVLLRSLETPADISRLLTGDLMLVVQAHLVQTYGKVRARRPIVRGTLTRSQERRAKELMSASLDAPLLLADVARECCLSVGHFTRAFRQSTGMPPHRWLLHRRIETAKAMLLAGDLPTVQIALACGFADQSSFTRSFARVVGVPPATWARTERP